MTRDSANGGNHEDHDNMESRNRTAPSGGRLLKAVEAIAISPDDARDLVNKCRKQSERAHPGATEQEHTDRVAAKLVQRYSRRAATVGGASGVVGIVPGTGSLIAAACGATADAAVTMKLQVDMCLCLALAHGHQITDDDGRHLGFLLAAGGTLEKVGRSAGMRLASAAGVRLLRLYVRGAAVRTLRQMFRKIGVVFARRALERALPFGIGLAIGAFTNYMLTRYVGNQAIAWFRLARAQPQ